MMARDVMSAEVFSITGEMTLRQVAQFLVEHGISGAPVVDKAGLPVGMVTENDLIALHTNGEDDSGRERWLTRLAQGEPLSPAFLAQFDRSPRCASDVMTAPVVTVTDKTTLHEVASMLAGLRIKRLPVVRDGVMVGIVSRTDLVRQIADEPVQAAAAPRQEGLLSVAFARVEEQFTRSKPAPHPTAGINAHRETKITADAFSAAVDEFGQEKNRERDEKRRLAAEQRQALVKDLLDRHVEDKMWRGLLSRAKLAAEAGEKELLLLRFPSELCSDGGRAINAPLPEWPETLRGEAAEIYVHWERDLKPNGFHLNACVLDFPDGMPGDIGLTLVWAES